MMQCKRTLPNLKKVLNIFVCLCVVFSSVVLNLKFILKLRHLCFLILDFLKTFVRTVMRFFIEFFT